MPTVPEFLRHDLRPGQEVVLVLRSGVQLTGRIEEVDLVGAVVRVAGWAVRLDEIAGVRGTDPADSAAA